MKVLFLDSWTAGIHNFVPIARQFEGLGVECLLIHRGSWGAEPNRPREETIQGILCRDIAYYNTNLLYKVFQIERPDRIVLLTTNYFTDRAEILAARKLGIKSIFLMHGVRETDPQIINDDKSKAGHLQRERYKKISKYLRHVLPNYFYSGIKTNPFYMFYPVPWKSLWEAFRHPAKKVLFPTPCSEIHCDKALVYANIYRDFFSEWYGYPRSQIEVVGNPSLDSVFALKNQTGRNGWYLKELGIGSDLPAVVYLASPFVEAGYDGWTSENRINQIEELGECCRQAGCQLVVKLHPATKDKRLFNAFGLNKFVSILLSADIALLVDCCSAVIGHHSSTLLTPIVLGKPLLVQKWGLASVLNDRFSSKGVARAVTSAEELTRQLEDIASGRCEMVDAAARENYFRDHITHTDGKSMQRIVRAILS